MYGITSRLSQVDSMVQLVYFFTDSDEGGSQNGLGLGLVSRNTNVLRTITSTTVEGRKARRQVVELLSTLREFAPGMRSFGLAVASRLVEKSTARLLRASSDAIFGINPETQNSVKNFA